MSLCSHNGNRQKGLLSLLWPRNKVPHSLTIPNMLSKRGFLWEMVRERDRADRAGLHFLLVSFDLIGRMDAERSETMMNLLGQAINRRVRVSDTIGWYGPERYRIGLLLPNTAGSQAESLILEIEASFIEAVRRQARSDSSLPELACRLFPYPNRVQEIRSLSIPCLGRADRDAAVRDTLDGNPTL